MKLHCHQELITSVLFLGCVSVLAEQNRQAPQFSCPTDTIPYREKDDGIRECIPKNQTASCPDGFFCNYDGLDDRYICCGKPPGYCVAGKVYIDPKTEKPKACTVKKNKEENIEDDCKSPYVCTTRTPDSDEGYCCLMVSDQEPPPVGCPFGYRPLKNSSGNLVQCTPNTLNSCPGKTTCYLDSVEKIHKCCGKDPGEGCQTGTKAVKTGTSVILCSPGDPSKRCPGSSMCQWSYLIDRYQCCESDNGCPAGMSPIVDISNRQARKCQKNQPATCGPGQSCEFNFWTAEYQCCGQNRGICPVNQVANIEQGTGLPQTCSLARPSSCPIGYRCTLSTTNQYVCCGQVGQCPPGMTIAPDAHGRPQTCTMGVQRRCTPPATCQPALGSFTYNVINMIVEAYERPKALNLKITHLSGFGLI